MEDRPKQREADDLQDVWRVPRYWNSWDDYLESGPISQVIKVVEKFHDCFLVKKADIVSPLEEDTNETFFPHRRLSMDDKGWYLELDKPYVQELVRAEGLEHGDILLQPDF